MHMHDMGEEEGGKRVFKMLLFPEIDHQMGVLPTSSNGELRGRLRETEGGEREKGVRESSCYNRKHIQLGPIPSSK